MYSASDLERYLLGSGYTEPALREMRPLYGRILRFFESRGHDAMPPPSTMGRGDTAATNDLLLAMHQTRKERTPHAEHELRNLAGIRSYKP